MPSPLGHLLAGAAIAAWVRPAPGGPVPASWIVLGGALAALPDADVAAGLVFAGGNFREWHRELTHGVLFLPLAAAAAALLFRARFPAARTALLACAALLSHVVLDLLTGRDFGFGPGYAVRLLEPFSASPFSLPVSLLPGTRLGPGTPPWAPWNLRILALETAVFGGLAAVSILRHGLALRPRRA